MKSFKEFSELEAELPVNKVRMGKFLLWPFLRIYLASELVFGYSRQVQFSGSWLKRSIKYAFYGFRNWFGNYDILVLSSQNQRKLIDGKYYDRMDFLDDSFGKVLILEAPSPEHHPRRKVASKHIVSRLPMIARERLLIKFLRSKPLEGTEVLNEFQIQTGKYIDSNHLKKRFEVQYRLFYKLLKRKKAKVLVIVNSYTNMAYVKAAHDLGLKVIELQHGTIVKEHYAYNISFEVDRSYYPDYLLTFGTKAFDVFDDGNHFISRKRLIPIGSFFIDHLNRRDKDSGGQDQQRDGIRICLSGQEVVWDKVIINMFSNILDKLEKVQVSILPRTFDSEIHQSSHPRLKIEREQNVYDAMRNADLHITVNSTTAFESLALGTPNLLWNFEGRAKNYFQHVLGEEEFTSYFNVESELLDFLTHFKKSNRKEVKQCGQKFFASGFQDRLNQFFKDNI